MNRSKKLADVFIGISSVFILIQMFGCALKQANNPIRQSRLIQLQSFIDKKYTKKEVLLELGVPLQRIDVEETEVWKYYFSRGYTHVKETKFVDAQSYEKRETINLFFDSSGQVVNFRYVRNFPDYYLTAEAILLIRIVSMGLVYCLVYLVF